MENFESVIMDAKRLSYFFRDYRYPNWMMSIAYLSFSLEAFAAVVKWSLGVDISSIAFWSMGTTVGITLSLTYLQSFLIYWISGTSFSFKSVLLLRDRRTLFELVNRNVEDALRQSKLITDNLDGSIDLLTDKIEELKEKADKYRRENPFKDYRSKLVFMVAGSIGTSGGAVLMDFLSRERLPELLLAIGLAGTILLILAFLDLYMHRPVSRFESCIEHMRRIREKLKTERV